MTLSSANTYSHAKKKVPFKEYISDFFAPQDITSVANEYAPHPMQSPNLDPLLSTMILLHLLRWQPTSLGPPSTLQHETMKLFTMLTTRLWLPQDLVHVRRQ